MRGQHLAVPLERSEADLLDVPLHLDARGLDDQASGLRDLGSDPVSGDQRDAVGQRGCLLSSYGW